MAQIEIELSDGKKAGETLQELTKQANTLNSQIKKLKPGSEEFINKSKDLKIVGGRIGEVKDQIKGTTEASNGLKEAFDKYVPFSGTFKKIGQELGFVKKGVGGLTGSFGILRTAIIATGIGALIVLLGSLVSWFTSTQEGMDKVTAVTRPLNAIMQRLKGVLQELGGKVFKQISESINDPKQAFIDLGKAILDNVIKRFESLALFGPAIAKIFKGDFKEGFKDLGDAAIQLTTGIEDGIDKIGDAAKSVKKFIDESIDAGTRLDQLQKQIEKAENKQIVRSKELDLIIKQQKKIVEDITKSYTDRIIAAGKARAAQDELEKTELNLLDLKIAKKEEEHKLNATLRSDDKELAELIAKRLEVQARVAEQSIEFDKKISELRILQKNDEIAAQQRLQEEIKAIEDLRLQAAQESRERDLEELQLNLQRQIEILDEHSPLYGEHLAAIQAAARKDRSDINAEWDKKDLDAQTKHADEEKKIAKEAADAKAAIAKEEAAVAGDFLDQGIQLLGEDEKARKKNAEAIKAFSVAKILTDLGQEIAGYFANPASTATLGAIGTAKAIFATIRAGAAISRIQNQKFEYGGVLKGPSHRQGGIPIEAEGDEIVLTKGVYRNPFLRNVASQINHLGGGRKFEAGGPVQVGASSISPRGASSGNSIVDLSPVVAEIRAMKEAIDARIDRIQVSNNLQETRTGLGVLNSLQEDADV